MRPWVVIDFETCSGVDLPTVGAWRYAEDPTTEVLCLGWSYNGAPARLWLPGEPNRVAEFIHLPDVLFIAHNVAFEKAIWRNIMVPQFGFPDIPNDRWHDIMATCAQKVLPQKLDRALKLLGLQAKDNEGTAAVKALGRPHPKTGKLPPRTPEVMQRIYDYCRSDIEAEVELHRRIGFLQHTAQWSERQVWLEDQEQNERGVCLDMEFVEAGLEILDQATIPLLQEFRRITNGLMPTQVAKFLEWCSARGARLPNLQKETLAQVLGVDLDGDLDDGEVDLDDHWVGTLDPQVHRALSIRQLVGSASIKKLGRMKECVCADGQTRGLLQYHGTGPGRRAGRLWQVQNMPRGTVRLDGTAPPPEIMVSAVKSRDAGLVEALLGPSVDVLLSSLRHAIVPRPGRVLAAGDLAGIQARVVLALAGQWDKVELMASGADVYLDMATAIYKPTVPFTKKANVEERQTGKNSVLGLGFGMGPAKFHLKYCLKETQEFAANVVRTYRKEWAPEVPKFWYGIEDAALKAVQHPGRASEFGPFVYRIEDLWLTVRLPSGRKLWYFGPELTRRAMPWDETDVREGWCYRATKNGQIKHVHAFGALQTENVVMGIERDLVVCAARRLEHAGYPVILDGHDEIVTEPLIGHGSVKEVEDIMSEVPAWAAPLRIPIATEAWMGDRYRK